MANGLMKIGAAVAVGYILGRTRKGRLLLTAAGLGMAARGGLESRQGRLLEGPLGSVGKEVAGQLQTAAGKALAARVDRLSDALEERTANLRPEQAAEAAGAAAQAAASAAPGEAFREEAQPAEAQREEAEEQEPEEQEPTAEEAASRADGETGAQDAEGEGGQTSRAPQRPARARPRGGSTSGR